MALALDPDFAEAIDRLIEEALQLRIIDDIEIVSAYRSSQEQRRLFVAWRQGRSPLPAAAPGTSYHEFGLAIDVSVSPANALTAFGEFAESRGFRWGGRFGDPVHIDAGNDFSIEQARKAFVIGNLVEVS